MALQGAWGGSSRCEGAWVGLRRTAGEEQPGLLGCGSEEGDGCQPQLRAGVLVRCCSLCSELEVSEAEIHSRG